jgi:hypothetical protein
MLQYVNHDYRVGIKESGAPGRMAWVMESILRSQWYYESLLYSDPDFSSTEILVGAIEKTGVTVLRNEWIEFDVGYQKMRGSLFFLKVLQNLLLGCMMLLNQFFGPW